MSRPTTLYRFYSKTDELLYVGITYRMESRLPSHRRDKAWHEVHRIEMEHFNDRETAAEREALEIRTRAPRWNVIHNTKSARTLKPRQIAQRMWPDAEWIVGRGRWASVAYCRVTTVQLYDDIDQAEAAKSFIDRGGCGGRCYGDHEVVYLMR